MTRTIILGNAGAGKTTLARRLSASGTVPILSLDDIAWDDGPVRKPIEESHRLLTAFLDSHAEWVIEGCYADLLAPALPRCDELLFLNPGVEVCVVQSRSRPWEPGKFVSPAAQDAMLEPLIEWIRRYDSRADAYGHMAHREVFEGFSGRKRELTSLPQG